MQYMGGKAKAAPRITNVMLDARGSRTHYLEPFLGGCHVLPLMAPYFEHSTGCDVVPDVVMLWQEAVRGWRPPRTVSRELYADLRHAEPSALRAFVGFGCSFGGKWWGGYASNERGDDFAGAARDGVLRKVSTLDPERVTIALRDYTEHSPGPESLVYCDPPYAGTTAYKGAPEWDAEAFWSRAREWVANGALVFVSEYAAPSDWQTAWGRHQLGTLSRDSNADQVTERLFVHESQVAEAAGVQGALF